MTGHTCSCSDLTIWMEKLVKSLWVNLFLAGFSHLEPLCAALPPPPRRGAFFDELLSENGIFLVVENQLLHTIPHWDFCSKCLAFHNF